MSEPYWNMGMTSSSKSGQVTLFSAVPVMPGWYYTDQVTWKQNPVLADGVDTGMMTYSEAGNELVNKGIVVCRQDRFIMTEMETMWH